MTLYFDTSALVKLVVIENGSDLAAELWGTGEPVASSLLCHPEARAALAAGRRGKRITARQHGDALERFEAVFAEVVLVGVDAALARHAGELADELGLRGYDAVHLASALVLGSATTLVTWDGALARAAMTKGCSISPPLAE